MKKAYLQISVYICVYASHYIFLAYGVSHRGGTDITDTPYKQKQLWEILNITNSILSSVA